MKNDAWNVLGYRAPGVLEPMEVIQKPAYQRFQERFTLTGQEEGGEIFAKQREAAHFLCQVFLSEYHVKRYNLFHSEKKVEIEQLKTLKATDPTLLAFLTPFVQQFIAQSDERLFSQSLGLNHSAQRYMSYVCEASKVLGIMYK